MLILLQTLCPTWMIILGFGQILHYSVHVTVNLDKQVLSDTSKQHSNIDYMDTLWKVLSFLTLEGV